MNAQHLTNGLFLIGRVALGGMYLGAGIGNLTDLPGKAAYTASKGLTVAPAAFVTLASALLIIAGVCFITGLLPRIGVLAIVLFLVPVTVIMHGFWAYEGMQRVGEMHAFMGNLGLLGSALLLIAIPQPWPYTLSFRLFTQLMSRHRHAWASH